MSITRPLAALLLLLALDGHAGNRPPADPADLRTLAEDSGFARTGRYEEVGRLCQAFARAWPQAVRCDTFGRTPEGRPMHLLVASTRGLLTPAQARAAEVPVVLVQGGIHAGEIDGKDAGFLALREMLAGEAAPGALDKVVLLFVPVFNVDGHERFGRWNRPNQRGPEEMGWRTTGRNHNLNRDYAKAESPEMQAMLALVDAWEPILTIDLHATDGARFEHDIAIQVEPLHAGDERLRRIGRELRDGVIERLTAQGHLPLPFYPSFEVDDDPSSGFADGVAPPRFSTGYFLLRNRFSMLVETHSWRTYPERVRSTRNTVIASLERAAAEGAGWLAAAREADARASRLGGQPVALGYAASPRQRLIDFRGYAYTREPSEISGALMTRYDESTPQLWRIPLRDEVQPALSVTAPEGGYLVPAAWAEPVAAALRVHGIAYRVLPQPPAVPVQSFRPSRFEWAATPLEGRQRLTVEGSWADEALPLAAGSLYVPIAQPKSRLVMALFEPQAPDSLLAWGLFNNAFERKEYMEDYVAEQVAREMLAADPALRAEFEARLRDDPAFAANPAQRLQFFYRRHSSWDSRFGLYPVLRTNRQLD